MNDKNAQAIHPPPSLMAALRGGFDAITNNILLILFPVALDLFLWFGPRLSLRQLIQTTMERLAALYSLQDPGAVELMQANQEIWMLMAERFNLFVTLRSYPVGVFSLMASRLPLEAPVRMAPVWEITNLGAVVLAWLAISILGLVAASIYFSLVSQAALTGQADWRETLPGWRRAFTQVVYLAIFWLVLMLLLSLPGGLLISVFLLGGGPLGLCAGLLFGGLLVALIIPLLFSPHGIFVYRQSMFASLKKSVGLTRLTLPGTSLFFLLAVMISEGLDVLWRVPPEASWFSLIGVFGHAFVTTGLLAASFIYYREADRWVQSLVQQLRFSAIQEVRRKT